MRQWTQHLQADTNQALAVATLFASRPCALRFDGFRGVRGYTDEAVEVSHPTSTATAGTATMKPPAQTVLTERNAARSCLRADSAGRERTVATGIRQRGDHADPSMLGLADDSAIRELVDAYADCADRRDVAGQMALFTEDTELVVFAGGMNSEPTKRFRGRAALAPVFDELKSYRATMHFNGQSCTRIDDPRASAVTCCHVHELGADEKPPGSLKTARSLTITAIRYLDSFVKSNGKWLIRQRQVVIDWTETRAL